MFRKEKLEPEDVFIMPVVLLAEKKRTERQEGLGVCVYVFGGYVD